MAIKRCTVESWQDQLISTINKASPGDVERSRNKSEVQAVLNLHESSRCEAMRQSTIRYSKIVKHRDPKDEVQASAVLDPRDSRPAGGSMTKEHPM